MTKRRISQQQSARIKKNQDKLRLEENQEGLVVARFGRHAEVEDKTSRRIHCNIRTNLDSLVAGDRVVWAPEAQGRGIILSLCPRSSVLCRPDRRNVLKPIAANISQMVIVIAPKPEPSWELLDSYLVMAECLHLDVCIVLNKVDLEAQLIQEALELLYRPLDYTIVFTSKQNLDSYERVKETLKDQTSVIVGQSGVGKSSLIAGILPHETGIQTGEISEFSELGCHTTSNSRLYHLTEGGSLIDSPGIRELGLWQMPQQDLIYGFREIRPLIGSCKYRNCNHHNTPGCALDDALSKNLISERRYKSFLSIVSKWNSEK